MVEKKYQNLVYQALFIIFILGCSLLIGEFDVVWVEVIFFVSVALSCFVIFSSFGNIIFAARLFLLYIVGAYPLGVKLLDKNLYFSVFEFNTQTTGIATAMYALTLIALPAAYMGWAIGERIAVRTYAKPPESAVPSQRYYLYVFYLCSCFALLSGYLIVSSSTGTIFDSQYGSGTEGDPILGSASAIGGVALSVMFYCALLLRRKTFFLFTLLVACYLLIWCQILRGLRQDVVGVAFSCVILFLLAKNGNVAIKLRYILYVFPLMLALELWGLVRTGLSSFLAGEIELNQLFDMGLGNAATMPDVVYSGTLGPITTTFANTVYLVKEGAVELLYGSGYFDYILRTPPEFLYPGRPKDYATMFPDYGLSSGGGFFELAEAYLNFGAVGVFIMPLLISVFIAFFFRRVKQGMGMFYVFALSALLCVWMRGAWYQTFAFYKSFISAAVLFATVHFAATVLIKLTRTVERARSRSVRAGERPPQT